MMLLSHARLINLAPHSITRLISGNASISNPSFSCIYGMTLLSQDFIGHINNFIFAILDGVAKLKNLMRFLFASTNGLTCLFNL